MESIDFIVIAIYFLGIFAVGVGVASRNNTSNEMFAAGGQSPWWTSGLSAFMTMFSANTFVIWGGIAYRLGMVAIVINMMYGVAALLVGYFVAGRWKRMGVESPAQYIQLRYGTAVLHFFMWFMTIFKMLTTAGALYAMGRILVALIPLADGNILQDPVTGNLSLTWAIVILSSIVVTYTMVGGLWAVLITDVLQFIVLNMVVLFVIPLVISRAGSLNNAVEGLGNVTVDAAGHTMLSPMAGNYAMVFLAGWCIIHFFMIGAEWAFVQRFICVPDVKSARKSAYLFGVLYLISPMLWLLPPMLYRLVDGIPAGLPPELLQYVPATEYSGYSPEVISAIQAGNTADVPSETVEQIRDTAIRFKSEAAYVNACKSVLPVGMMGLMFAAMFSATASMVSSQLNVFSGALTNEIFRPKKGASITPEQSLWRGRFFTALLGAVLIAIALAYQSLGGAEKVIIKSTEAVVVALLAPTIWGLFSRKVNHAAVWYTAATGIIAGIIVRLGLAHGGFLAGVDVFAGAAAWVQSNMKLAETLSGVALPVLTLVVVELTSRSVAPGYARIQAIAAPQKEGDLGGNTVASRMPAIIVGWAVGALGLLMLSLAFVNKTDQAVLAAFGLVMMALAAFILRCSYRK